jgi:hypothetical protein
MAGDDNSESISREQAAAALATIERSRGLIEAEQAKLRGQRYVMRGLFVLAPLVEYAPKDLIRSRAVRWTLRVGWQAALFALGQRPPAISRMPAFRSEQSLKRPAAMGMATVTAMAVSERLVVHLLRRSRLRRPNVVAGFAVAPLRAGFRFVLGRITRAGQRTEPVTSAELHPALLRPDTLRLAALLGGGEMIELSFLRETFGVDRLGLAEVMQPLVDEKLLKSITIRDDVKIYLTPDGRDAFARHEHAVRELVGSAVSTGDTPR